jgi:HD-GYP domain-containing protein (c-di-GMP phosphodiesterase class II)
MFPDAHGSALRALLSQPFTLSFLGAVLAHDYETHRHLLNVGTLSLRVAVTAGLSEDAALAVGQAGLFHDVGKIDIDPLVLSARRPLDEKEWDLIRAHPARGEAMLRSRDARLLARIVRSHHERLDGSGYPDGLRGMQIPWATRLLSVVDAYDAMRAGRPYAEPIHHDEALARLLEARHLFDEDAVAALVATLHPQEALTTIS